MIQGPYLNSQTTHLQRSVGDDNVLIVKFEDGAYDPHKIAEEGIFVGLRQFRFFGDYFYFLMLLIYFCENRDCGSRLFIIKSRVRY